MYICSLSGSRLFFLFYLQGGGSFVLGDVDSLYIHRQRVYMHTTQRYVQKYKEGYWHTRNTLTWASKARITWLRFEPRTVIVSLFLASRQCWSPETGLAVRDIRHTHVRFGSCGTQRRHHIERRARNVRRQRWVGIQSLFT